MKKNKQAMANIFQKKKLVNCMSRAPNPGKLLFRCKFELQNKNHEVKKLREEFRQLPLASIYLFKRVSKTFLLNTLLTL